MPKTHQDRTDTGLLHLFASAQPLSIIAAFEQPELFPHVDWEAHRVHQTHPQHEDEPYRNSAIHHDDEPCPSCGDYEGNHHGPQDCPYGGCEPGEHCPWDCPYETGHTDWDRVYPHLPDTMHRGMSLRLDHDFDPAAPPHHMARTIAANLREYGSGIHWTPNEDQARHYAAVSHRTGDDLHVVLHAAKPRRDDIEEDPHELLEHDVIGFDQHEDAEIPLQQGVPIHLTGISYRRPNEQSWTRHVFKQPMEHRALLEHSATAAFESHDADDFDDEDDEGPFCHYCESDRHSEDEHRCSDCGEEGHEVSHDGECPYSTYYTPDMDHRFAQTTGLHRGMTFDLDERDHRFVHNDRIPAAHRAGRLLARIREGGGFGTYWAGEHPDVNALNVSKSYAVGGPHSYHNTHVVLHAEKPDFEHVITDPRDLEHHNVWAWTHENPEIGLYRDTPVNVTGISWKPSHSEAWTRHDFKTPIRHHAAYTAGGKPWLPHDRFFGPGHRDLDPRLFDGTRLKPAWRRALLGLVNRALADYTYRAPGSWQRWARAYLAGSQASHWYGNDDLDVLVGIDYDAFRHAQPRYRTMSDREIDDMLNARAHEVCDPARWFTIGGKHLGPFDSTVYVNPDSFDIRKIKPYAAYDLGANRWAVEPMQVPDDFGPDKLPSADFLYARSLASQVRALRKLPVGQAQALGAALYDKLHGERHDAFSGHGGGLYDVRNIAWKYLALHPEKPMEQLVAWKRAEQAGSGLATKAVYERPALVNPAADHESNQQAAHDEWFRATRHPRVVLSGLAALSNPEADHGSNNGAERDEWSHGTHHDFDTPQVNEDAERAAKGKDWNTSLGTHWTSRHDVAEQVALGQPHETEFMGRDELQSRQRSARVLHARLHIANPKRYRSEYDMDREVYGHEYDSGNHPSRHDPEHLSDYQTDPHLGHEQDLRRFPDWEQPHHDDEEDGDNWYGEDESSGDARGRFSLWLSHHPDRYGIAQRFKQRLIDAGHDGIVYGNEYEGRGTDAEGHASAITFYPHQAEIRQAHRAGWDCLDEDEAEDYRREHPGHPHTAGMNGPGSDATFEKSSVMIALVPPRDLAERLVLPDGKGEPVDQLHVTLAYIPHVDPAGLGRLTGTVAEWASRQRPITARVQGLGTFVNDGEHPLWAAIDIPGSSHLHSSLVNALRAAKFEPSDKHGFVPHMTLSYNKYHVRFLPKKIVPESFTCHSVYVCRGDNWRPVPLSGGTAGKVA